MKKTYSKIECSIISCTDPDVLTLSVGGVDGNAIELNWDHWDSEVFH